MSEHLSVSPQYISLGSNGKRIECYITEKDHQPQFRFNLIKNDIPLESFEISSKEYLENFALALIRAAEAMK